MGNKGGKSEQGSVCSGQEEICNERAQEMDRRREVGAQAAQYHGLLRRQWQDRSGEGFVRKGQEHSRQVTSRGVLDRISLHCSWSSVSIRSVDLFLLLFQASKTP